MWSHPSVDSSRWMINSRAGAGTGGQARDCVHWSTRSGPSSWRPYQTVSAPRAHTFTIRSFAQTATNFPGDASLAARRLTKPAKESVNWQRQRHRVGALTFAGVPRGPTRKAMREQLSESISAASLETSLARRPPPEEALDKTFRRRRGVATSFSTGNLHRPLTTETLGESGPALPHPKSLESLGMMNRGAPHSGTKQPRSPAGVSSAPKAVALGSGTTAATSGKGGLAASLTASPLSYEVADVQGEVSPRPVSSGGDGGHGTVITRSLNHLSPARSSPGPYAWGGKGGSKGTSAREVLLRSPSLELTRCRSSVFWIAQRGQLTERNQIFERELTKDSPLLLDGGGGEGGGEQRGARGGLEPPSSVEPTGVNERLPITLSKNLASRGADRPSPPPLQLLSSASGALSIGGAIPAPLSGSEVARLKLERKRAGWSERFVHGSPVLDGSRRWPDAGRIFVR